MLRAVGIDAIRRVKSIVVNVPAGEWVCNISSPGTRVRQLYTHCGLLSRACMQPLFGGGVFM